MNEEVIWGRCTNVVVDILIMVRLDSLEDIPIGGGCGDAADWGRHGYRCGYGCGHGHGRVSNIDWQQLVGLLKMVMTTTNLLLFWAFHIK